MAETPGPRRAGGNRRYFLLLIPPLLIAVALSGVLVSFNRPNSQHELDGDLCEFATDQSGGRAVLLLDFRKPIDDANLSLPGELVRDVSMRLSTKTELRVFALSADPRAPRLPLDRICKPYDNADLQIRTAKDQPNTLRDCDDLPAQISSSLRESAERFCRRRDALNKRVEALVRNPPATPITNSYLIEALEDTAIELSEGSGPRTIYVFSDMMQHAPWYSHLDLEWTEWAFADFAAVRAEQVTRMGRTPLVSDLAVRIYYPPRADLTDQPRPKRMHQAFWRAYFAGTQLTLEEQPVLPAYAAETLMNKLTPEELAARERERIEQEREEAQRILAEVQRERAALEEELRKTAEERIQTTAPPKAQPERSAEVRRQQQSLAQRKEQLNARQAEARDIAAEEPAEEEPAKDEPPPPSEVAEQPVDSRTDDMSERESVGQLALATDQSAETELPPCDATLMPRFLDQDGSDIYPGRRRMNYGAATITIQYSLDETGATVDDQVTIVPEESTAQRPRLMGLFADAATRLVRNWVFEFEDEGACSRRQERSIKFEFRYN